MINDRVSGVYNAKSDECRNPPSEKSPPSPPPLLLPTVQGDRLPCPTLKTLVVDDDQEIPQELIQGLRVWAEAGFPLERVVFRAWHFEEAASE